MTSYKRILKLMMTFVLTICIVTTNVAPVMADTTGTSVETGSESKDGTGTENGSGTEDGTESENGSGTEDGTESENGSNQEDESNKDDELGAEDGTVDGTEDGTDSGNDKESSESDSDTENDDELGGDDETGKDDETGTDENPENPEVQKQEWNEDGALKVLIIGHSFGKDTLQYVYRIGKNLGIKAVKTGLLYIGGCSLTTHLKNAKNDSAAYTYYTNDSGTWVSQENYKMKDAVLSDNWDFICFQQASSSSGVPRTYDDLVPLIEIVEGWQPTAKLGWNMTWAYQSDTSRVEFGAYIKSQTIMYEAITSTVQQKIETNDKIDVILPVGTAVQNARTSYLGDTITRDGYHMSFDIGRYIAGVAFFHALTGISVDNLTYMPSGTGSGIRDIAIESANNAVMTPYEVTSSQYDQTYWNEYYAANGKAVCIATGGDHVEEQDIVKATMTSDGTISPTCTKCFLDLDVRTISQIGSVSLSRTTYNYSGKNKTPSVTVLNSAGEALVQDTDYTVTYPSSRKTVGTHTVTVKFKGNYSGSTTLSFTILPKATKVSKLTAKKKQITVKWSKISAQRTGYQIQYSTSATFASKKTVKITSNTTSKTIKSLKKNKKYYFRIRTYTTVSGKNYYSPWSATKSVKTKK